MARGASQLPASWTNPRVAAGPEGDCRIAGPAAIPLRGAIRGPPARATQRVLLSIPHVPHGISLGSAAADFRSYPTFRRMVQLPREPKSRELPIAPYGPRRDVQHLRDFFFRQAAEVAEFNYPCLTGS